jgi:N-acetylmuramoyl-L-alanine amidase
MEEIKDNKLVGAEFKQSPNVSGGPNNPQRMNPDMIVIHYTASKTGSSAMRAMMGGRKVSAHLCIEPDGTSYQLSDFNTICWHAGQSSYAGRSGLNGCSIGIEVVNVGYLKKIGDNKFVDAYKQPVDPENVYHGKHRNSCTKSVYWHKYPEKQVEKIFEICQALCKEYDIQFIVGHEEIAPCRKQDPGPAFPLDEFRRKLLGGIEPGTKATVKIDDAGIYTEPDENSTRIEDLDEDEELLLFNKKGDWYKVREKMQGWVAAKYIDDDNTDDEWDGVISVPKLNFRSAPGGPKLAKSLVQGTKIKLLSETGDWANIEIDVEGWVHQNDINLPSEG